MCERNAIFDELFEKRYKRNHSRSVSDLHKVLSSNFSNTTEKKQQTNKFTEDPIMASF